MTCFDEEPEHQPIKGDYEYSEMTGPLKLLIDRDFRRLEMAEEVLMPGANFKVYLEIIELLMDLVHGYYEQGFGKRVISSYAEINNAVEYLNRDTTSS